MVSFHGEYERLMHSFMGKGVTRRAVLCLRHLMHEMLLIVPDKVCKCQKIKRTVTIILSHLYHYLGHYKLLVMQRRHREVLWVVVDIFTLERS